MHAVVACRRVIIVYAFKSYMHAAFVPKVH